MEWFFSLNETVQAAIIGGVATVCAAIIAGLFAVWTTRKKRKNDVASGSSTTTITQTSSGSHNTFIGIQNNGKDGGQ